MRRAVRFGRDVDDAGGRGRFQQVEQFDGQYEVAEVIDCESGFVTVGGKPPLAVESSGVVHQRMQSRVFRSDAGSQSPDLTQVGEIGDQQVDVFVARFSD